MMKCANPISIEIVASRNLTHKEAEELAHYIKTCLFHKPNLAWSEITVTPTDPDPPHSP